MNVEEFKKMSRHDQLFYVMFQDDGETFKKIVLILNLLPAMTGHGGLLWTHPGLRIVHLTN